MTASATASLRVRLEEHLAEDELVAPAVTALILGAYDGAAALELALSTGSTQPPFGTEDQSSTPLGAYISAVTVEGFRGIGRPVTLELPPGPGLTLVIGRNGSGKSSLAEGLEVLLTGDNRRWAERSSIWRDGWRNLHHPNATVSATLAVEGQVGSTVVERSWSADAELNDSTVVVQPQGQKKTDLRFLGWSEALVAYRPFLSYSELGSMLDEGPSKLHDAVSSVLGLEALTEAEKALRDARLSRERELKAMKAERDEICALLDELDDDRARAATAALRRSEIDFDSTELLVMSPATGDDDGELALLNRICGISFPSTEAVDAVCEELRESCATLGELAGTQADKLLRGAELLQQALAFRAEFGVTTCPVCATPETLTDNWAAAAEQQAEEQAAAAGQAARARTRYERAIRTASALVEAVPQPIQDARELIDVTGVIEAWRGWAALKLLEDAAELGNRLPMAAASVRNAIGAIQGVAGLEVKRRQDAWRPVALQIISWLEGARDTNDAARSLTDLKKAETWLKAAALRLRNERFAPIADEAMELWRLLRQRSNIQLGRIELEGSGTRRKVTLDVTVDGVAGAALGVMSQGELHALALSLFFPRATLEDSPFRFIVVDDPVQSMDPAKVDGLAAVLDRAAQSRQVIVFTHDDRLPESIRRLGIEATVVEVARGAKSEIELRPAMTPVERYIEDARAVVRTPELPPEAIARVVPGFCRLALDAACTEAVRRRRLGRGEAHADVEKLLADVQRTTILAALALFDDETRGGDVLGAIDSRFGRSAADAFQQINRGVHAGASGDLRDLVREAAVLARKLAELA